MKTLLMLLALVLSAAVQATLIDNSRYFRDAGVPVPENLKNREISEGARALLVAPNQQHLTRCVNNMAGRRPQATVPMMIEMCITTLSIDHEALADYNWRATDKPLYEIRTGRKYQHNR